MDKKWNIVFVLIASGALLAAFFFLMPTNKFESKIDFDSVYIFQANSDNFMSMIQFKKEEVPVETEDEDGEVSADEKTEEKVVAYYTVIEAVEDVYLYRIYERELSSVVEYDENHVKLDFFSGFKGNFEESNNVFVLDGESDEKLLFDKKSVEEWEEEREHYRGRIGLLNTQLEEENPGAVEDSKKLREDEEEMSGLHTSIIEDMNEVVRAVEAYALKNEEYETIVKDIPTVEKYNLSCDDGVNLYCEMVEMSELLKEEFEEADRLSRSLNVKINTGDTMLQSFLSELEENTYNSKVAYGEDYFTSLTAEAEEIVKNYNNEVNKLNEMIEEIEENHAE